MNTIRLALVCLVAAQAALGQEPSFSGGDGSTCEQAVVPLAAEGMPVVQAEYHWLRKAFGGGTLVRQALGASSDGKRRYDLIAWRKPDGPTVEVSSGDDGVRCNDPPPGEQESVIRVVGR